MDLEHHRLPDERFDTWGSYVRDVFARITGEDAQQCPCVVRFRNMNLGVRGARAVFLHMIENKTMTEVDCSGNNFGPDGMRYMGELVKLSASILELDLAGNLAGNTGAAAIAEALQVNRSLEKLVLRSNFILEGGAHSLSVGIQFNNSLTHLDLTDNSLSVRGCYELGEALKHSYTLTYLSIAENRLTDHSIVALSQGLMRNRSIRSLVLSDNMLTKTGVKFLMHAVRHGLFRLSLLDLSNNELGPEGCRALCTSLSDCRSICCLLIRSNRIGDMGCKHLGEAIGSLAGRDLNLRVLDISNNSIARLGIQEFANVMEESQCLTNLDVSFNEIGRDGGEAILQMVNSNHDIVNVAVEACCIPEEMLVSLKRLLERNSVSHQPTGGADPNYMFPRGSAVTSHGRSSTIRGSMASGLGELMPSEGVFHDTRQDVKEWDGDPSKRPKFKNPEDLELLTCVDPKGVYRVINRIRRDHKDMVDVCLAGRRLGCSPHSMLVLHQLAQALTYNVTVLRVDLMFNSLGVAGAEEISRALAPNDTITELCLSSNFIGADGSRHIAELLLHNTALIGLRLDDNDIRDDGMKHLCRALCRKGINSSLRYLSLQWNGITKDSGPYLNNLLCKNTILRTLNLTGNLLGNNGVADICEDDDTGLRVNRTLQRLDLGLNCFGDRSGQKVLDALRYNVHGGMQWVGVEGNSLSPKLLEEFRKMNARMKRLRETEQQHRELAELQEKRRREAEAQLNARRQAERKRSRAASRRRKDALDSELSESDDISEEELGKGFTVGSKVLARFFDNIDELWGAAVIEKDDVTPPAALGLPEEHSYRVRFKEGDSWEGMKPHELRKPGPYDQDDPPVPGPLPRQRFQVGAPVEVKYYDEDDDVPQWDPAVIVQRNDDGTYRVEFDDGEFFESVPDQDLRQAPPRVIAPADYSTTESEDSRRPPVGSLDEEDEHFGVRSPGQEYPEQPPDQFRFGATESAAQVAAAPKRPSQYDRDDPDAVTFVRFTARTLRDNSKQAVALGCLRLYNAAGDVVPITDATNPGGVSPPDGLPANALNCNGKRWLDMARSPGGLVFELARPTVVREYAFQTAGHPAGEDPVEWTLEGSGGGGYRVLDKKWAGQVEVPEARWTMTERIPIDILPDLAATQHPLWGEKERRPSSVLDALGKPQLQPLTPGHEAPVGVHDDDDSQGPQTPPSDGEDDNPLAAMLGPPSEHGGAMDEQSLEEEEEPENPLQDVLDMAPEEEHLPMLDSATAAARIQAMFRGVRARKQIREQRTKALSQKFKKGMLVTIHSLVETPHFNGLYGRVLGVKGERVGVHLPDPYGKKGFLGKNLEPIQEASRPDDSVTGAFKSAEARAQDFGRRESIGAAKTRVQDEKASKDAQTSRVGLAWGDRGTQGLAQLLRSGVGGMDGSDAHALEPVSPVQSPTVTPSNMTPATASKGVMRPPPKKGKKVGGKAGKAPTSPAPSAAAPEPSSAVSFAADVGGSGDPFLPSTTSPTLAKRRTSNIGGRRSLGAIDTDDPEMSTISPAQHHSQDSYRRKSSVQARTLPAWMVEVQAKDDGAGEEHNPLATLMDDSPEGSPGLPEVRQRTPPFAAGESEPPVVVAPRATAGARSRSVSPEGHAGDAAARSRSPTPIRPVELVPAAQAWGGDAASPEGDEGNPLAGFMQGEDSPEAQGAADVGSPEVRPSTSPAAGAGQMGEHRGSGLPAVRSTSPTAGTEERPARPQSASAAPRASVSAPPVSRGSM